MDYSELQKKGGELMYYYFTLTSIYSQMRSSNESGITSNNFYIKIGEIPTIWNLSIQFWMDNKGIPLASPVVMCLNLVKCSKRDTIGSITMANVRHKFEVNDWSKKKPEGVPEENVSFLSL